MIWFSIKTEKLVVEGHRWDTQEADIGVTPLSFVL